MARLSGVGIVCTACVDAYSPGFKGDPFLQPHATICHGCRAAVLATDPCPNYAWGCSSAITDRSPVAASDTLLVAKVIRSVLAPWAARHADSLLHRALATPSPVASTDYTTPSLRATDHLTQRIRAALGTVDESYIPPSSIRRDLLNHALNTVLLSLTAPHPPDRPRTLDQYRDPTAPDNPLHLDSLTPERHEGTPLATPTALDKSAPIATPTALDESAPMMTPPSLDGATLAVHIHDSGTENILSLASLSACGWDVRFKGGPVCSAELTAHSSGATHPLRRAVGGCYYLDLAADPGAVDRVRLVLPNAYSPTLHTAFKVDSGAQISLCTRGASLLLSEPEEPFLPTTVPGINGSSRTSGGGFLHLTPPSSRRPARSAAVLDPSNEPHGFSAIVPDPLDPSDELHEIGTSVIEPLDPSAKPHEPHEFGTDPLDPSNEPHEFSAIVPDPLDPSDELHEIGTIVLEPLDPSHKPHEFGRSCTAHQKCHTDNTIDSDSSWTCIEAVQRIYTPMPIHIIESPERAVRCTKKTFRVPRADFISQI